ncbi:MAG: hypothetical protein WCJ58_01915 [bacterium]
MTNSFIKKTTALLKRFKFPILALVLGLLLIVFLPVFYLVPVANSLIIQPVKNKSFVQKRKLLYPSVIVFTKTPENNVQANFITLKRKYLIWWQLKELSTYAVKTELSGKSSDELIADLTDEITSGKLHTGNNLNLAKVNEYDQKINELNAQEYETLGEFSNEAGDQILKSKPSADNGSYLELNAKKLAIEGNPAAPAISPKGDLICYSKYQIAEPHAIYSGKVYCMTVANQQEYLLYEFGENIYFSLGLNQQYLIYSLSNGEIGVVDLASKKVTKILKLEMLPESDPNRVVYVDVFEAIINPNDLEKLSNNKQRIITLNLQNLSWQEN